MTARGIGGTSGYGDFQQLKLRPGVKKEEVVLPERTLNKEQFNQLGTKIQGGEQALLSKLKEIAPDVDFRSSINFLKHNGPIVLRTEQKNALDLVLSMASETFKRLEPAERALNETTGVPLLTRVQRSSSAPTLKEIGEVPQYRLPVGVLDQIGTKGLDWAIHKKSGGNDALKDLRKGAILIPSAYNTANDVLQSLISKKMQNCKLYEVQPRDQKELAAKESGRDFNFVIKYDDNGVKKELSLRFFAPGSDTKTSDIDLSVIVRPPGMFTDVWKKYDKNANNCLHSLNNQIRVSDLDFITSKSLAKTFDINLYSPGFSDIGEGKKSVFHPKTPEGLEKVRTADMGLGMVRTIEILAKSDQTIIDNELGKVSQLSPKYQTSFDFALQTQLQTLHEEAESVLKIAESRNFADPKLTALKSILQPITKSNPLDLLSNTNNLTDSQRKEIIGNINLLHEELKGIKDLEHNGINLLETARKDKFLECHEMIEQCITDKSVTGITPGASDDLALKAHLAQGRGTMYADEAYNNATSIHKIVEERQQGKVQYQTVQGAISSIESDYGFILHHKNDDAKGFLNSTGKYLSRVMDQAATIDISSWVREIGSTGKTGMQIQEWAKNLEFIKNFDPVKSDPLKTKDILSYYGITEKLTPAPDFKVKLDILVDRLKNGKAELCNELTNIFLGKTPNADPPDVNVIIGITNSVRDYARTRIL